MKKMAKITIVLAMALSLSTCFAEEAEDGFPVLNGQQQQEGKIKVEATETEENKEAEFFGVAGAVKYAVQAGTCDSLGSLAASSKCIIDLAEAHPDEVTLSDDQKLLLMAAATGDAEAQAVLVTQDESLLEYALISEKEKIDELRGSEITEEEVKERLQNSESEIYEKYNNAGDEPEPKEEETEMSEEEKTRLTEEHGTSGVSKTELKVIGLFTCAASMVTTVSTISFIGSGDPYMATASGGASIAGIFALDKILDALYR